MILIKGIRFRKIHGIALWPFVLVRGTKPHKILLNHERIHLRQQVEMLVVFFYIWYVLEWFYYFMKYKNWWRAYYQISFEREAYLHENDLEYLKNRRFWAFRAYL